MANVRIITKGVLFDEARREGVLNKAIERGTKKLLPRVEAAVKLKAPGSGTYRRSIISKSYATGTGVVKSNDPRKIREWLETGRRRGVKTRRKGAYMWRAGKALAKRENKAGYYEAEIAKALNG